jgi:hypothetical protein
LLQKEDGMLLIVFFLYFLFNIYIIKIVDKGTNEMNQRIDNDYKVMVLVKDRTYAEFICVVFFCFVFYL